MTFGRYEYDLTLTSQFYFCGLPLRLDSYSSCQFGCTYCFARARGGNIGYSRIQTADSARLDRRLDRIQAGKLRSTIDEFLANRQPIHFGGMSDPFIPLEARKRITHSLLSVLGAHNYPTIISTKSDLVAQDEYLKLLRGNNVIVQFSISSLDDSVIRNIDIGTPGPTRLLHAIRTLTREGIPVAIRIQPFFPGRISDAIAIIDACAEYGVRHVAVEHLKLPLESSWTGTRKLENALGVSFQEIYSPTRSRIDGRERILVPDERIGAILELREYSRSRGLTFGAADTDFLHLSDGSCCCSGADLILRESNHFRYNYLTAIRRGVNSRITIESLKTEWRPKGSIARYLNSRTRAATSGLSTVETQIQTAWNGDRGVVSPARFYGVERSNFRDENGYQVYHLRRDVKSLVVPPPTPPAPAASASYRAAASRRDR